MTSSADEIKVLHGLEGIRVRPRMYIKDFEAPDVCDQLILETLCHAVDEFIDGHCTKLAITVAHNLVELAYDAGICLAENEYGESYLETICTALYACRHTKKHAEAAEKYCGIGLVVVNAVSNDFYIETVFDGQKAKLAFHQGNKIGNIEIDESSLPNHTYLRFSPDSQILPTTEFHIEKVRQIADSMRADFPNIQFEVVPNQ